MQLNTAHQLPTLSGIDSFARYQTLSIHYEPDLRALSYGLNPDPRPCFTQRVLEEIHTLQRDVERWTDSAEAAGQPRPVEFLIARSDAPEGVWLGGDLAMFVDAVRAQDSQALARYAHLAIEVLYANYRQLDRGITTVAFLRGDTLGAGFESALSCDLVIAEESVSVGFPEILFNMFPGMGAYSFLSRRTSSQLTERMILGGKLYDAEQMAEHGAIDHLLPNGAGPQAVIELLRRQSRRLGTLRGLHMMRRRCHPVTFEELRDIAHQWVDTAMALDERAVQRMDSLRRAQDKRFAVPTTCVASEM